MEYQVFNLCTGSRVGIRAAYTAVRKVPVPGTGSWGQFKKREKRRDSAPGINPGYEFPPNRPQLKPEGGNPVTVAYTNACSIGNKWNELNARLTDCNIIAISETWLNAAKDVAKLYPPGHHTYRADRKENMTGGGAMLMVAAHYPQQESLTLSTTYIQAVACKITLKRAKWTVACIYRSPSATAVENQ